MSRGLPRGGRWLHVLHAAHRALERALALRSGPAQGQSPGSCRVSVRCGPRSGVLFLKDGRDFAAYAQWRGADAAYALLTEAHVEYEVTSDVSARARLRRRAAPRRAPPAARGLGRPPRGPRPCPGGAGSSAAPPSALAHSDPATSPPASPARPAASSALPTPPIVVLSMQAAAAPPRPAAPAPASRPTSRRDREHAPLAHRARRPRDCGHGLHRRGGAHPAHVHRAG